ncbi:hypothetical protein GF312_15115 [Candidatus Poribacteria bacterium]|nr:hypothetical protein [Candidatus Poribacteria bacterium]
MLNMKPPRIYIHKSVYDDEKAIRRLDRIMTCIQTDNIDIVNDENLAFAVEENNWLDMSSKRTGELKRENDPIMIFNTFRFLPEEEFKKLNRIYPSLSAYHLLGTGPYTFRNSSTFGNGVCKSAYEIHSAWGCYHACDYCHVKDFVNIMLNLEDFVEYINPLIKREKQQLYKYDNQTDTICFEPEYGASELLVNYFARQKDKYLMLYTKSDNIEHLLELDHAGHTIINWTLSCETVAEKIEKKAPSMDQRIHAAELCQKAGYTVRFRFSPIIPIKNWRDENAEMIKRMFSKVKPDLITMDVLGWMSADQIVNSMDIFLFDDKYRQVVEEMAGDNVRRIENSPKQIFPHNLRLEIYNFFLNEIQKINENIPIAICMETHKMWKELSIKLGMNKENYICCCGPVSVPGNPMFSSNSVV